MNSDADLVRRQVSVLVADGPSVQTAKAATTTIPIVFMSGGDPVQLGLVASLSRPGGNVTGVTNLGVELGAKATGATARASSHGAYHRRAHQPDQRHRFGGPIERPAGGGSYPWVAASGPYASTERDLDTAFLTLVKQRAGGLAIGGDGFFNSRRKQMAALAARHALPTIYQGREFAAAGGLMSKRGEGTESWHLAGVYTGRILKGEKPVDLPVQQLTKVELIINMKTAKTLGLTIPLSLLPRADEVIE